jgi:hypothetical protein
VQGGISVPDMAGLGHFRRIDGFSTSAGCPLSRWSEE